MVKIFLSILFTPLMFLAGTKTEIVQDITVCGSSSGIVVADNSGKFMTALTGWGKLRYPVSTKVDSAQFYFNQGLSMYYSYHFPEAVASFKEASRLDPACAMTYWGQALAMGPYYNTYVYRMPKEVPEIVATMTRLSSNANEKEKDLIAALQQRYSDDLSNSDRKQLDRAYATALASLGKKYGSDSNIKALYVDAVMMEHKWDFWNHDGTPKPWTPEVISICEEVLKNDSHPAIMHYYIHLTEASREPNRALNAADQLKDAIPGVGHMVHMSSHMYQRNGLYTKGVKVNEDAHNANNNLDTKVPSLKLGKNKSIHYYAVQSYCAMTAGMYTKGLPIYDRARDKQVAMGVNFEKETYPQFVYMMPVMARVRMGKWDEILKMEAPNEKWTYASALYYFAKGMAHVRKNELTKAKQCQGMFTQYIGLPIMQERYMPFNSPEQSTKISLFLLGAEIAALEGNKEVALMGYNDAIKEEDNLVYREPQDWLLPARQYLGAYLLKVRDYKKAEEVFKEDLVFNPGNGWSAVGMCQALKAQKKSTTDYEAMYQKAFVEADAIPPTSVF